MKPRTLLAFSFKNLWRRKLRSFLTIWGMSVGIGAMVLLLSFAAGLQQEAKKTFLASISLSELHVSKDRLSGGVFLGPGPSSTEEPKTLTDEDVVKLRSLEHVRAAYPSLSLPPLRLVWNDQRLDVFLETTLVEQITEERKKNIERGKYWAANEEHSIVLSPKTLTDLGITNPDDILGQSIILKPLTFTPGGPQELQSEYTATVTGLLKTGTGFAAFTQGYLSQSLADTMTRETPSEFGAKPGTYFSILVIVDDPANVKMVQSEIEALGWFASGAEEVFQGIDKGFLIMKIVLGIIGGIALFVALIGIANSMLMAVLERTREIGILKALGASRRTISALFLLEASWLGAFGAILGIGGAFLIGRGIVAGLSLYFAASQQDGANFPPIHFSVGWQLGLGTLIGAIIITLIAGWLPAQRAARQDPVHALRHE